MKARFCFRLMSSINHSASPLFSEMRPEESDKISIRRKAGVPEVAGEKASSPSLNQSK